MSVFFNSPCGACGTPTHRPAVRGFGAFCPRCRFNQALVAVGATELDPATAPGFQPDEASELLRELDHFARLGFPRLSELLRPKKMPRAAATSPSGGVEGKVLASAAVRRARDHAALWAAAARLVTGEFGDFGRDSGQPIDPDAEALGPAAPRLDQNLIAHRSGVGLVYGSYDGMIAVSYGDPSTPRRVLVALPHEKQAADALDPAPWLRPSFHSTVSVASFPIHRERSDHALEPLEPGPDASA